MTTLRDMWQAVSRNATRTKGLTRGYRDVFCYAGRAKEMRERRSGKTATPTLARFF
jgi:hypothetical protein